MQDQPAGRMDVTSTIGVAFNRAIRMMFKPFDIAKWFAFGLMIFLEALVEGGGGGGNYSNPFSSSKGGMPSTDEIVRTANEGMQWLDDNIVLVLGIGVPSALLLLLVGVLIIWVGCRGQMMFIRAVAVDDASIGDNWRITHGPATSLFKFRVVLSAIGMVIGLGTVVAVGAIIWRLLKAGSTDLAAYALQALPILGVGIVLGALLGLVESLLRNFVAPLMYKFDLSCADAWRKFSPIAKANIGPVFIFLLLRFLIGIAGGIAATILTLLTCCIGGLPVIHQALMSPFYVFDRAWSLYALGTLGPEFVMVKEPDAPGDWSAPAAPPMPPTDPFSS